MTKQKLLDIKHELIQKLFQWREHHISHRQFILILSLIIGIFSSIAAYILKSAIHLIQHLLTSRFDPNTVNYWYFILPFIGITLSYLFVRYVVKDDISHGVTKILYAFSQRKSIIRVHNIWSSIVSSVMTIGFGGSVGGESPIVLTGSAIGSNLGKLFKLDQKTLMLLIGCGAAGAIGGIFKAPMTGLVFTLEVLLLDMTMTSLVPILISSISATSVSYFLSGSSFMFSFTDYEPFSVARIPQLIALGVVCGFISLYFTRGMNFLEGKFRQIREPLIKLAIGGATLGLLLFIFPPLYGEGYNTIEALLNGNVSSVLERSFFQSAASNVWLLIVFFILIIIFKIFASTATTSPGGVGGIFAPSLFVGAIGGYMTATIFEQCNIAAPKTNFTLAGMAGVMTGVMHAPLTGIFLIAELSGGYNLFMTLMVVSVFSYLTIILFEPHSLYAMRLAQKGELITHHKDQAVLTLLKMDNVIETDLCKLTPNMKLGEIVKIISNSKRNIFPVVEPETEKFLGVVSLDEIRNIMFRQHLYNRFTATQLMNLPPARVNVNLQMVEVMKLFEDTNAWNLPVIDDNGKYVGFVSKSKIFNSYRELLVEFYDE